jgi:hypothetical protein
MKNLLTFNEFLNESRIESINELKTFSPANVKQYNLNKSSVSNLNKWSYKLEGIEVKFLQPEDYWNKDYTPQFIGFLEGSERSTAYSAFTINGESTSINIYYGSSDKPGFYASDSPYKGKFHFIIKQSEFLMFIAEVEDKIDGFVKLLDHLFKTYESDIQEKFNERLNLKTLHVIPVGEIAPGTGKTPHGWSIYDQPSSILGIAKGTRSAFISANSMKIGDKFKVMDDQKRKEIFKEIEIIDLVPCNWDSYIKYCKSKGYEVPVGAFQKQLGRGRLYLYSIK